MNTYTYLALGDSYTIGEQVLLQKSFPYLAVQLLREKGLHFNAPEIIAKTGWTTSELANGINTHVFLKKYDFVSLLIGVNNQYRGLSIDNYKSEFEELLQKAIGFCSRKEKGVIVLSIPDYGITPFGIALQKPNISGEIDLFNSGNKSISNKLGVHYINITDSTRNAVNDPSLIAEDNLHPSAKEYEKWARKVSEKIADILSS